MLAWLPSGLAHSVGTAQHSARTRGATYGLGPQVARRIATAVAIKLTLRLLSRIGMGAAIASAGWLAGIVVSLGLLVVEELLIAAVDKHRLRYETPRR